MPRVRCLPASDSGAAPGRGTRRGGSWPSESATTWSTGPSSCARSPRSTRTWPSTSSTRTPATPASTAWPSPPGTSAPPPRRPGSPPRQREIEAVPGGPVDVVAVLHRAALVVVGPAFHGQQRRSVGLAQRPGLGGGGGPRPDGLLGQPRVDPAGPQQLVQAARLQVRGPQPQQARRDVIAHERERLGLRGPEPL